jgi:flagellar hook-associated protein 2
VPQIDGIVSKIDTTAIIEATVGAAAVPRVKMQAQVDAFKARLDKIAGLSTRLTDVATALRGMDSADKLEALGATVSVEGKVNATVGAGAVAGRHSVVVSELASSATHVSQGFADKTAAAGFAAGSIMVSYAGVGTAIPVDGATSLSDLAEAIDGIDGLSAVVVDTGKAGSEKYRLLVRGEDTGAENTVEIDTSGLSGGVIPSFTETVAAKNAQLEIDGVAFESATNHFAGVLPGVTLDVVAKTDTPITLEIAPAPDSAKTKVTAFVDAYNAAVSYRATNAVYDAEKGLRGALAGEPTTQRAMERISRMVSAEYNVGGDLTALSQIGISTQRDGSLKLDEEKFAAALEAHPDSVQALFTSADGPVAALATVIEDSYVDADTGSLSTTKTSLEGTIRGLETSIERFDSRLEQMAIDLRARYTAMELSLARAQTSEGALSSMVLSLTTTS